MEVLNVIMNVLQAMVLLLCLLLAFDSIFDFFVRHRKSRKAKAAD